MKVPELTEPAGVVRDMPPDTAPAGITTWTLVADSTVNEAAFVPNRAEVVAPRFAPVRTTFVPTGPRVGLKVVMVGTAARLPTVKFDALVAVPPAVVTLIRPVVAPLGTPATMVPDPVTVNAAVVPLNFTEVAPTRFAPERVTAVPTPPDVGLNPVIVGLGGTTVRTATSLSTLPAGLVTRT